MIRYYFVKVVSKATTENPSHAGESHTSIYGKEETLMFSDSKDPWIKRDNLDSYYLIQEYGYKHESHAKRSYLYRNPTNNEYWNETVEIVSVDVEVKPKSVPFDGSIRYKMHRNF